MTSMLRGCWSNGRPHLVGQVPLAASSSSTLGPARPSSCVLASDAPDSTICNRIAQQAPRRSAPTDRPPRNALDRAAQLHGDHLAVAGVLEHLDDAAGGVVAEGA